MSLSQTKTIVANQVAYGCKQELYGLHFKNKVQWSKMRLKTLVLKAIDNNSTTNYFTTAQINQMLAKISNPNINL